MAYDEAFAERIRQTVGGRAGVTEKKMFGGLAFLLDGKMFCGIAKDELVVRVGAARYEEALRRPHVRPMDFTGRPMRGYVYVGAQGRRGDELAGWIALGIACVQSLADGRRTRRRG